MAFMREGDIIDGYCLLQNPKLSGQSTWSFARKSGQDFFIKKFLQPLYPSSPSEPGGPEVYKKRLNEAKVFERRQKKLASVGTDTDVSSYLVVPLQQGWVKGSYIKVFRKIEVHGATHSKI